MAKNAPRQGSSCIRHQTVGPGAPCLLVPCPLNWRSPPPPLPTRAVSVSATPTWMGGHMQEETKLMSQFACMGPQPCRLGERSPDDGKSVYCPVATRATTAASPSQSSCHHHPVSSPCCGRTDRKFLGGLSSQRCY